VQERFDVAVVGNVGIDTNVYSHSDEPDFSREANFTENLDYVGQAGGYASRGYAQLGRRTAFIGYVGDDFSGRFIRAELAQDGIDQSAMFIDPAGTSRSINFMYRDGRRKNFYDGKSHMLGTRSRGMPIRLIEPSGVFQHSELARCCPAPKFA
jgi:sugar/nucleoside kinase (ribokinase family)